jgi:hypothetical protein
MDNNSPKPAVTQGQKTGVVVAVKGFVREVFGQLVTAKFWKDLFIFTAKTAVRMAGEMLIVAGGHAIVEAGRKFGKGGGSEMDAVKAQVHNTPSVSSPVSVATPAATAFARGFSPGNQYVSNPTADVGPWPGMNNGFR